MQEYQNGKCGGAERGFRRVMVELPARSPGVAQARFYLGECLFRNGQFLEASREFGRVADEHPVHDLAPRALLRSGDALARLWKRPELDPTYGEQAMLTYSDLLRRYPQSDLAAQANERLVELGDKFARKDLKTAEYYVRVHAYDAAMIYLRQVVARFPNSEYAPIALLRLVGTYRRIGYEEEATETCAHLRRFYPDQEGLDEQCPAPPAP
jgi:outer membrane protein assembly factor BamD